MAEFKFYCIGDEDTARGFRLAGVQGWAVAGEADCGAALDEAAARADCGAIIMTKAAAGRVRAKVEARRLERARPLLGEI